MPAQLARMPIPATSSSNDRLEAEIMQLSAQISAATYRLLMLRIWSTARAFPQKHLNGNLLNIGRRSRSIPPP